MSETILIVCHCPASPELHVHVTASAPAPVESAPGGSRLIRVDMKIGECIHGNNLAACWECRAPVESAPGAATTKCACGSRSVLTATGVRYEDTSEAICKHTAKACQWFHPAAHPFAVRPAHPCGCGHGHLRGSDGEDGGCSECDCTSWRAPASPPAEPPAPPDDVACYCGAKRLPFSDRAEITSITGSDGVEHRKDQCIGPAAEPGTCPVHKTKWIEGTTCPKCGGRRFWHSGMGETTTDEHQKCIGPCGMDRFVDGIDS